MVGQNNSSSITIQSKENYMRSLMRAFALSIFLLMLTGIGQGQQNPPAPKDVNVSITLVGKVWKVVLTGTTTTAVHVVKGQRVIFHAEGSDVYIQFDNDQLFGGHYRTIKSGKTLTLGVGNVVKGIYVYSAFCEGPKVFAEGDSPPKIIVD
jgi:hypothetical protein